MGRNEHYEKAEAQAKQAAAEDVGEDTGPAKPWKKTKKKRKKFSDMTGPEYMRYMNFHGKGAI